MTCQREKEPLEQIEQTGQMYKVSALQLIKAGKRIAEMESLLDRRTLQFDGTHPAPCAKHCEATAFWIDERRLRARIAELESLNGALCRDSAGLVQERDALAAQNQALLAIILNLECGSPTQVLKAQKEARSSPDLSTDILRARDARRLREIAERLRDHCATGGDAIDAVKIIHKSASELEKKK